MLHLLGLLLLRGWVPMRVPTSPVLLGLVASLSQARRGILFPGVKPRLGGRGGV